MSRPVQMYLGILLIVSLFTVSYTAKAATFKGGSDQVRLPGTEVIDDDIYVAAGNVQIDSTVNGDVFVAGGQVSVSGTITGDLFIAGGQVTMRGVVNDDLRVAGGSILIEGKTNDDVMAGGGDVEINQFGVVGGDVMVGAGNVIVAGETGTIRAAAGQLSVSSSAKVHGDIWYESDNEINIEQGAAVDGTVHRSPLQIAQNGSRAAWVKPAVAMRVLITIIMALLFSYLVPVKTVTLAERWRRHFAKNLLWGLIFLLLTPLLILILFITVLGIPLAVGLIMLYIALLYLGHITGVIAVGSWLLSYLQKTTPRPLWLSIILGAVAVALLEWIPVVGWIAALLIFLAGLGALLTFDWELVKKLRSDRLV